MDCKIKKKWVDIELEHTKSRKIAKKIAKDHIKELGCRYYPALMKMEKRLKEAYDDDDYKKKKSCKK